MGTSAFTATLLLDGSEIYKTSAAKLHPLGTRGFTRDGRVYRYARNGATAIVPGDLIQASVVLAAGSEVAAELADSTDWAVPTTNSTSIRLSTDTSLSTANFFEDGYFMVTAGTTTSEVGQIAQIESHPGNAGAAGATGAPIVYLYTEDKLVTALTTANTISMNKNAYDAVVVADNADSAITAMPVGVCPAAVAVEYYFWLQTWGLCPVWTHGTADAGHSVFFSSSTGSSRGGDVHAPSTVDNESAGCVSVGMSQYIGVTGTCGAVMLTLAP
jgi:hypothetical protein